MLRISLFLGLAVASYEDSPTDRIDTHTTIGVQQAWRRRGDSVKSVRIRWAERHCVVKGAHTIPPTDPDSKGVRSFPAANVTFDTTGLLLLAGSRMRFESEGARPHWENSELVQRHYISTFDGEIAKTLKAPAATRKFPQGLILKERNNADVDTIELEPLLMHIRIHDPATSPFGGMEGFQRQPGSTMIDGEECFAMAAGPRYLWVSPTKQYAIVRHELRTARGGTARQTDIRYALNGDWWIPASWKFIKNDAEGNLASSVDGTVTETLLNAEFADAEFRIDFPVGALIQDLRSGEQYMVREEGERRLILNSELPTTYEEISRTSSGNAKRTTAPDAQGPGDARREPGVWLIRLNVVVVVLVVGYGIYRLFRAAAVARIRK